MTTTTDPQKEGPGLEQFALDKLTRVLGQPAAARMLAETLSAIGKTELHTPDDLYAFGEHLAGRGGFEAAVGGLLTVAAVLRGANARSK